MNNKLLSDDQTAEIADEQAAGTLRKTDANGLMLGIDIDRTVIR